MKKYHIAVVGATGLVGRTILKVLEEKHFPIDQLYALASAHSAGMHLTFDGRQWPVEVLDEQSFDRPIDLAFFAAGGAISEKYAPLAAARGIRVIDNSSVFRMEPNVPLIVPEVNAADAQSAMLIANPNCSTIQCMLPLKALQERYGLRRIVYSSYQAVSGSGQRGLEDLQQQKQSFYPHPIHHNIIPHIDSFLPNGYTREEMKMIDETRKILHDPALRVTATTVRVPVEYGHCVSVNVELNDDFAVEDVRQVLASFPGIVLQDDPLQAQYPMPILCRGHDEVYVGRIRRDESQPNALNLWVSADNIRKGAATNAVQIAELLLEVMS